MKREHQILNKEHAKISYTQRADRTQRTYARIEQEIAPIFNKQVQLNPASTLKNRSFGTSLRLSRMSPSIKASGNSLTFNVAKDKDKTFNLSKPETITDIPKSKPLARINQNDVLLTINAISGKNAKSKDKSAERQNEESYQRNSQKAKFSMQSQALQNDETNSIGDLPSTIEKRNSIHLHDLQCNKITYKKVNFLRYKENVFRAACKLTKEIPPFPDWSYQDDDTKHLMITKINVGGQIFEIFGESLLNIVYSKLTKCISSHQSPGIPFFDRDFTCFSAILNFYRTGRLHVPANTCLTLFEEELEFWGISEQFMEPCCWSEFETLKRATNTLKKYGEDLDKDEDFNDFDQTIFLNARKKLYKIMTVGTGNILARWVSSICALFILLSIYIMIVGTTPYGRVSLNGTSYPEFEENETVSHYLSRTKFPPFMINFEFVISGYFMAELLFRLFLCPNRLELFSDTLNWVDLLATVTTLLSNLFLKAESTGNFEGYMLLLKLPRIFRLFKLTAGLRSGMDAFTLTLRACANELRLIFLLLFIMTAIFGSLIFVVEMVNESSDHGEKSAITNIYLGMWWAIVSMTTVGFGDFVPITTVGYVFGSITIMVGVIICQLPVPIVLKNFSVYNNQASARLTNKNHFKAHISDPELFTEKKIFSKRNKSKRKIVKNFRKMFKELK